MEFRSEKKLPRLAEGQEEDNGTCWIWIALASEHRLILAVVVGPRTQQCAHQLVYGDDSTIASKDITTSLVERLNLTLRRENSTLQRKTLSFAKDEAELKAHLALQVAYYHFVRPHLSLREKLIESAEKKASRRWQRRTPAMSAKITDHIWSLRELLTFRPYITSTN